MFMFDWSALMTPPPCVHFRGSNPIDVSHLSFNILCLLFLEVSSSVFAPKVYTVVEVDRRIVNYVLCFKNFQNFLYEYEGR